MAVIPVNPTLVPRHGSHHTANLKYGYFVFFAIDLLYPFYLWITKWIYHRKWSQTGRSTTYSRLVSIPLPVKIILWSCVAILLGLWNFEAEYINTHMKRFGRISYVLLPLDIFLSFRPTPIPLNNYLDLLVLHKWLSRLIILCAVVHSFGFFGIWVRDKSLFKLVRLLNFLGVIAFVFFGLLFIVSLKPIRRRLYKFFYLFHMITVWVTVFLIGFHARPGVTNYAVVCLALLFYQIGYRIKKTKQINKLSVNKPEGATLTIVTIPRGNLPNVFSPASHLRISHVLSNPKSWLFATHPYTIASLPQDPTIKLIVKETEFKINPFEHYSLLGPFDSISMNFFQTAENVCILCGGAGISYGLPIYNHFKKTSVDFISIKLVWVTRNKKDLYLLKELNIKGIDIYITNGPQEPVDDESAESSEFEKFLINDSDSDAELRNSLDSFDLDANPFNDPKAVIENSSSVIEKNLIHYGSRPNLDICFKKNLSKTADNANKWVIACGNDSLIKDTKRFAKKNGTRFLAEVYAM